MIEESERDLIESIIDFGDTVVREVMTPRPDIVSVEADATITQAIDVAIENGLTRLPVLGESADDVAGVVNVKDAVRCQREGGGARPVTEVVHEAHFVPETKRVAELLGEMQADSVHIAMVVDEYGGTAGLVTLEDLLEELVGEITDEFDTDARPIEVLPDGDVLVNASLNVSDLNEDLGLGLPEEGWDSVGGLVFGTLGRVPVQGDVVEVADVRMVVQRVDGRRISRVRMTIPPANRPAAPPTAPPNAPPSAGGAARESERGAAHG